MALVQTGANRVGAYRVGGVRIGWPGEDAISGITVTGTAVPTQTEADVVTGGKTIILTLTGDTFVTGASSLDGIAAGSLSDIPSNG